jgi:hypothetical protein
LGSFSEPIFGHETTETTRRDDTSNFEILLRELGLSSFCFSRYFVVLPGKEDPKDRELGIVLFVVLDVTGCFFRFLPGFRGVLPGFFVTFLLRSRFVLGIETLRGLQEFVFRVSLICMEDFVFGKSQCRHLLIVCLVSIQLFQI